METNREAPAQAAPFFNPMTGWESASRFQAATFDWMARAFQQWLALVTTVPPHFVLPPTVQRDPVIPAQAGTEGSPDTRAARSSTPSKALGSRLRGNDEGRALAKAEPKRPARKAKAKSAARPRARG